MRAVNLIPSEQRTGAPVGAGRSQGAAYAVLALFAGLAIMAVLYGKAKHEVSSEQAQATSLTNQAQSAEAQASQLAPYTSFVAMREQRTQAVETLLESRFDWAHVFHEFGRVLPADTSITSLDGSVGGSTGSTSTSTSTSTTKAASSSVASVTPPGTVPTFTVAGCAVSQPAVAQVLERLRLIDGVSEVELVSSTKSTTGGEGTSTGGCPKDDPAFTVQVTFEALPSGTAELAATSPTKTVADTTEKSASGAASSSSSPSVSSGRGAVTGSGKVSAR
jgi:Tfp pilus assembly protein PilN